MYILINCNSKTVNALEAEYFHLNVFLCLVNTKKWVAVVNEYNFIQQQFLLTEQN